MEKTTLMIILFPQKSVLYYPNDPMILDRQVCANSVDHAQINLEELPDHGLHCVVQLTSGEPISQGEPMMFRF